MNIDRFSQMPRHERVAEKPAAEAYVVSDNHRTDKTWRPQGLVSCMQGDLGAAILSTALSASVGRSGNY